MKLSKKIAYPYPIWGWQNNYKNSDIECSISWIIDDPSVFKYKAVVETHDPAIDQLIKDGKAVYACVATCSSTFYNEFFNKGKESEFIIEIPCEKVCQLVNLRFIIVAMEPIPNYLNDNLDDFYEGQAYIPKGGVLTLLAEADFEATPCGGKSVGDIIKVVENTWSEEIEYQTNNQKIRIALPTSQFDIFETQGPEYPHVLHATIVYRALLTAIGDLPDAMGKDYEWINYLKREIDEIADVPSVDELEPDKGYTIEEAGIIVDTLLRNPFFLAFGDLKIAENRK